VLGIVGESGCGKTTLARMLLGLIAPTAGEARIDGQPTHALAGRKRARLIQPVFQDPYSSLNPRRRIRDIVALPLVAQRSFTAREIARKVAASSIASAWRKNWPTGCRSSFPVGSASGSRSPGIEPQTRPL